MSAWTKQTRAQIGAQLGEDFERCDKGGFPHHMRGVAYEGWTHKETSKVVVFHSRRDVINMVWVLGKSEATTQAHVQRAIQAWEMLRRASAAGLAAAQTEFVNKLRDL